MTTLPSILDWPLRHAFLSHLLASEAMQFRDGVQPLAYEALQPRHFSYTPARLTDSDALPYTSVLVRSALSHLEFPPYTVRRVRTSGHAKTLVDRIRSDAQPSASSGFVLLDTISRVPEEKHLKERVTYRRRPLLGYVSLFHEGTRMSATHAGKQIAKRLRGITGTDVPVIVLAAADEFCSSVESSAAALHLTAPYYVNTVQAG